MNRAREANELWERWLDLLERQNSDPFDLHESQRAFIVANGRRLQELVSIVRSMTAYERLRLVSVHAPLEIISDEDVEECANALGNPDEFLDSGELFSELDHVLLDILSYASAFFCADASDRGDPAVIDDLLSYGVDLEHHHVAWVRHRVIVPVEQRKVIFWLMQCEYFMKRNDNHLFQSLSWPDYSRGSPDFYLTIIQSALGALRELRGRAGRS